MATTTQVPILDLDTLNQVHPVRINGQLYDLLAPGALSIFDLHRFGQLGQQMAQLQDITAATPISDDQAQAITDALDKMVRLVLHAPDAIHKLLSDAQRFQVVQAFNGLTPSAPSSVSAAPAAAATTDAAQGDPSSSQK